MIQVGARPERVARDWRRTVAFILGETQPGQDLYVRGGIDHVQALDVLGRDCAADDLACAIPIRHRSLSSATTRAWNQGDDYLDSYGTEAGQGRSPSGAGTEGTALYWTTNAWPVD